MTIARNITTRRAEFTENGQPPHGYEVLKARQRRR
jgi:hypothetical protein